MCDRSFSVFWEVEAGIYIEATLKINIVVITIELNKKKL